MASNMLARLQRLASQRWIARPRPMLVCGVVVVLGLYLFMTLGGSGHVHSLAAAAATYTSRLQHAAGYPAGHRADSVDLSHPDAPFVAWPLGRLCAETTWVPGLVFMCDNNSGGIGNIRNFVLTCLRYAIEAGATGFVLPQIETRSEADLAHLFGGRRPFDYFFDVEHFRRGLAEACPSLTLYNQASDVPYLADSAETTQNDHGAEHLRPQTPHGIRPEDIRPKALGLRGGCDYRDLNRHTDAFRARFHTWLAQSAAELALPPTDLRHPRLVQPVWGVQWEWPVAKDGPALANSLGGLLRLRRDVLLLGREAAAAMRRSSGRKGHRRFYGVHLRTEHDALAFWPPFDKQVTAFLETLREKQAVEGVDAVYLATGNASEAARFVERARSEVSTLGPLRIVTKDALLKDHVQLNQRLQSLTWDQQALVDFVVLLSCDFFVGVSPSSFSMTVAAKRHLAVGGDGLYTRPWRVDGEGDARSRLVGNYSGYWDDWLFMYDTLWP